MSKTEAEVLKFPAGTAIQFTRGCYSDFCLAGAVVTLERCDLVELGKQYMVEKEAMENSWDAPMFSTWLVTKGHVFPAEIQEVHVDDGYDFDLHKR